MIAFRFTFPGGRYHATPWGRHVNEADVAWPPEPVRILRALIATWWRKADRDAYPKAALDDLIDVLAAEPPVFHLPDAVHSHIRAFMPAPEAKRLIFDGFLKLRPTDPLIVGWARLELEAGQRALASHLLERLGYLGRAESWAVGELTTWEGKINATPRASGETPPRGSAPVDVMAARTPADWVTERGRQLQAASALKGGDARKVFATLPARLCDAIAVDTGVWQAAGWSTPPALRKLVYDRPEIGPLPTGRAPRSRRASLTAPDRPEVARFLLAGRPRPRVEDTLRIGEVLRRALMAHCPDNVVPPELSGRDEQGPLRDDPEHAHAFYLAEDADRDGQIDHLVVWSRVGFSDAARRALDRLTLLYISKRAFQPRPEQDEAEGDEPGRKEWRVALDQIGPAGDVRGSRLLDPAQRWISATPYLKPRHDAVSRTDFEARMDGYRAALLREWRLRRPDAAEPDIQPFALHDRFLVQVGPRARSPLHFARTRPGGRGGPQPDAMGAGLILTFAAKVAGPLAFGKHAHLGMGLMRAGDERPPEPD